MQSTPMNSGQTVISNAEPNEAVGQIGPVEHSAKIPSNMAAISLLWP